MYQTNLMKLDNLIEGQVIKRPSKYIKTPYVADILCENGETVLGHTASLGCCGLVDVNASILISVSFKSKTQSKPKNKANMKCTHTVYLSVLKEGDNEQIIGVHPKLAELLTETALKMNLLSRLQNIKKYRRETTIYIKDKIDSRFDFTGIDEHGIPFIMEVKNVPLADYEDVTAKERAKMDFSDRDFNSKVAYFPDGYRKKTTDTVSPRALKHIKELTLIKKELLATDSQNIRCIMCYVIQRTDVNRFQPSIIDPEYRNAFKEAVEAGVEIISMVVSWNRNGDATFIRDDLPISKIL
jgi:DNA-binding sugar fermentation-stimulating protein